MTVENGAATGQESAVQPQEGDVSRETIENLPNDQEGLEAKTDDPEPWKKKKHRVKINGKEEEVEYDELLKGYQLERIAKERLQEAARLRKEAEQQVSEVSEFRALIERLDQDPRAFFELAAKRGLDPYDLAEELAWERYQYQKLSPEQQKIIELERQLEAVAAEKKKAKEDAEAAQKAEWESAAEERIDQDIEKILKLSGLKPKPRTVARIAELYQASINATSLRPDCETIAQKVRDWYHQDVSELYSQDLTEDDLDKMIAEGRFPDHLVEKVAKLYARRVERKLPTFGTSAGKDATTPRHEKKSEKIGINQWLRSI